MQRVPPSVKPRERELFDDAVAQATNTVVVAERAWHTHFAKVARVEESAERSSLRCAEDLPRAHAPEVAKR